jgi:transposase
MYIEKVANRSYAPTILLRESYREGKSVRKRTLANLTRWPVHVVEALQAALQGKTQFFQLDGSFQIKRSLPHGHVAAVVGMIRKLKLESLLDSKNSIQRTLCIAMIAARILNPCSKLATSRGLRAETMTNSLAEILELEVISEKQLYKAMDWLLQRKTRIEHKLTCRHLKNKDVVLYDVTSSYYEGHTCILAHFGHSRDRKRGKKQIVFGLLCTSEGCPLAVEVFNGNTGDPKTLAPQIQKMRDDYGFKKLIWVGDRGLLTNARIREELKTSVGCDWITSLTSVHIRQLVANGSLDISKFDELTDIFEFSDETYPGERLIACYNPLLREERSRKREELLQTTEQELEKIAAATQRTNRKLKGKEKIGERVGKVIHRFKMSKHFEWQVDEQGFHYSRKQEQIEKEANLDGIYVVRTNVSAQQYDMKTVVRLYKSLSTVERAFRNIKTVDLHIRPFYHRLTGRIRAHIFLCMLAYYVEWHMRRVLAPILFEDDAPEQKEQRRNSVVESAQRSLQAEQKARTHRTKDGFIVHSFQSLLDDLATLTKNTIQPNFSGVPSFTQYSEPTPQQKRAFELLDFSYQL